MQQIRNTLLALLMVSVLNAQIMGGEQDAELASAEKQSTESTLEQVLLELVMAQTILYPEPNAFLESLPQNRQEAFLSLFAQSTKSDIEPNETPKYGYMLRCFDSPRFLSV